ncbi:MAG: GC-type dockerin domain-anchored protein [Phycisphaerales bacterium]|jgi:hypothetical protein
MQRLSLAAAIAATSVSMLADTARADDMYAVDSSSDSLYIFDSDTGATVRMIGPLHPDPTRYTTPISMAVTRSFSIFVINNTPAGDNGLSRVDRLTGLATHIGGNVRGSIAIGPGGVLYGTDASGRLGTVSSSTGTVSLLGGSVLPRLFGLDYNTRDGFFYGITSASPGSVPELLRINPSTGAVVATIPLSTTIAGSAPGSIAFQRDGDLVMTDNGRQLYEINIVTGFTRVVASTTNIPQGLGLAPCPADIDASGDLDIFDFLEFQNLFDAGDLAADFDGDGELTIFDFLAFQNAFDAGC